MHAVLDYRLRRNENKMEGSREARIVLTFVILIMYMVPSSAIDFIKS